jgi:integrase/recombinase XerD
MRRPQTAADAWTWYYQLLRDRQASPRTIETYRRPLRAFWTFLEPKPWWRPTGRDLERFLDRPASPPARSSVLTESTHYNERKAALIFYRQATAEGLLDRNPLRRVHPGKPPTPIPRALDLQQVRAMLSAAEASDDRIVLMLWLAYGAGLRCGEIATARVEDVRLHGRASMLVHGKGGKDRVVPLPPIVKETLTAHLARRARTGPLVEARDHTGKPTGRPMLPGSVSVTGNRWLKRNGFQVTMHQLRHTYATELLAADSGRNLRAVSRLLGHANTAITEAVYTSGYDADGYAAVALLPDPRRAS